MLGKVLGAAAGAEASKFTSAFGGPTGAVMGVLAAPLVRRLSIPGLIVLTAGGYFAKKWLDQREAKAERPSGPRKPDGAKRTRKSAPKAADADA